MENITCSPWEHCCGEGLTASCCSVTEVGFQQGLFKACSSRVCFLCECLNTQSPQVVWIVKNTWAIVLSGPQILTFSMIDGSDQQSESDTFEHLQLFVKKRRSVGTVWWCLWRSRPSRPAQPKTKFCKNKKMIICKGFVRKNEYRQNV